MCHYHLIPLFTLLFCIPYSLKKPHLIYIMLPKDLGHINYFLGMEAHASVMTLLYCSPYILDLLKRAKMDGPTLVLLLCLLVLHFPSVVVPHLIFIVVEFLFTITRADIPFLMG